jgi:predicted small integral membrane protein
MLKHGNLFNFFSWCWNMEIFSNLNFLMLKHGNLFEFVLPGANPMIVSYNASAVKIYYATGSLARFENRNIFY